MKGGLLAVITPFLCVSCAMQQQAVRPLKFDFLPASEVRKLAERVRRMRYWPVPLYYLNESPLFVSEEERRKRVAEVIKLLGTPLEEVLTKTGIITTEKITFDPDDSRALTCDTSYGRFTLLLLNFVEPEACPSIFWYLEVFLLDDEVFAINTKMCYSRGLEFIMSYLANLTAVEWPQKGIMAFVTNFTVDLIDLRRRTVFKTMIFSYPGDASLGENDTKLEFQEKDGEVVLVARPNNDRPKKYKWWRECPFPAARKLAAMLGLRAIEGPLWDSSEFCNKILDKLYKLKKK